MQCSLINSLSLINFVVSEKEDNFTFSHRVLHQNYLLCWLEANMDDQNHKLSKESSNEHLSLILFNWQCGFREEDQEMKRLQTPTK